MANRLEKLQRKKNNTSIIDSSVPLAFSNFLKHSLNHSSDEAGRGVFDELDVDKLIRLKSAVLDEDS